MLPEEVFWRYLGTADLLHWMKHLPLSSLLILQDNFHGRGLFSACRGTTRDSPGCLSKWKKLGFSTCRCTLWFLHWFLSGETQAGTVWARGAQSCAGIPKVRRIRPLKPSECLSGVAVERKQL